MRGVWFEKRCFIETVFTRYIPCGTVKPPIQGRKMWNDAYEVEMAVVFRRFGNGPEMVVKS